MPIVVEEPRVEPAVTNDRSRAFLRERVAPALCLSLGVVAVAFAAGADLIGGDATGEIGVAQAVLALMGVGLALQGLSFTTTAGWQEPAQWWSQAPAIRWADTLKFLAVAGQLALLGVVISRFRVENAAFYETIFPLTVVGFVIHHLLPREYRLRFFLGLSLTAIVTVFGLLNAAWLVGIGLVLAAITHLPLSFGKRVALLVLTGGVLAAMRAGFVSAPWSGAIWAILGSMFMFRLMLYMYDLRHSKEKPNIARTLSYFFMLPNLVFPLFPVVDFATFKRTYYDQDAFEIYQRGLRWMLRGVMHLIAYRFVYQHMVISQGDVQTSTDLARYLLANFLLYLRVSGQFHVIVGMLHMFGFRLPETHRFFYLSSSFTDFWRRINIYWKDFMMKVVYYPAYFRLKKRGDTTALVISTLLVFAITWFLHAYQWFWLLGRFLLSWTDVLFWTILAVLLVANSLREARAGRKRVIGAQTWTVKEIAGLALRITATFVVLCTLWSLWTSPTVADWFRLWQVDDLTLTKVLLAAAVLYTTAFVTVAVFRHRIRGEEAAGTRRTQTAFAPAAAITLATISLIYLLGSPAVSGRLGVRAQEMIRDLKVTELNKADASLLQRGYYEELVGVNKFNGQLWEVYARRPQLSRMPTIETTGAARWLDNYLRIELRPLIGMPYLAGTFRTNRWGMRDGDYAQTKPEGAYRIALMGPSHVAGWGVGDYEVFEGLLEDRLNTTPPAGSDKKYEVLNFAVPSWSIPQQLIALESKVLPFQPDAVWLVATPKDGEVAVHHLWNMIRRGFDVPFDYLRNAAASAGVVASTTETEGDRRLKPFADEIIRESYKRFATAARARGATPVWLFLSLPGYEVIDDTPARMAKFAAEAGFVIFDLSDVYQGHELAKLQYAAWDQHPNALGHRVIAEQMYQRLQTRPELLGR